MTSLLADALSVTETDTLGAEFDPVVGEEYRLDSHRATRQLEWARGGKVVSSEP